MPVVAGITFHISRIEPHDMIEMAFDLSEPFQTAFISHLAVAVKI